MNWQRALLIGTEKHNAVGVTRTANCRTIACAVTVRPHTVRQPLFGRNPHCVKSQKNRQAFAARNVSPVATLLRAYQRVEQIQADVRVVGFCSSV